MANKTHSDPNQQILDAAKLCYKEYGISKTGMKEVSQTAQVARSTLYRYFASKDDVLIAVIKQEMASANETISIKLAKFSQPADLLVEGLILSFKEIPKRPLLHAIFVSDEDIKARRVIWGSNTIHEFADHLLDNFITPAVELGIMQDKAKPEVMAEWIYRILLSFLTLPSNWIKTDKQMREVLHLMLMPVLLR